MSTYNQVTPASFTNRDSYIPPKSQPSRIQHSQPKPQSQTPTPQPSGLPVSLTKFVQNCHDLAAAKKLSPERFAVMQLQLRQLIEAANKQNKLWKNDWSKQKIPIFEPSCALELFCNIPNSHSSKNTGVKRSLNAKDIADEEMDSANRKKARAQRFERELRNTVSSAGDEDYKADKNQTIRGTSQALEKNYLRLTSAPDPSKVRPLTILQRAYTLILDKYRNGASYAYVCDQFKSMRQDLRVQLIENEFTVKVYETHARIALEHKDLGEFNQCQTVLKNLYQSSVIISSNEPEFLSYRILYHVFTRNYDVITLIKLKLTEKEKLNSSIIQALQVLKAQISNNYHQLFILYSKAKGTTRHLMDCFINNERVKALAIICRSYNVLGMEFLLNEFRFSDESDCMNFITEMKLDQFIELRGENVFLNTQKARGIIQQFLISKTKIDIKGQI